MPKPPLLLGHRGARATASIPENTLASFDLALQQGCDGFEFDVRLTADGHAVICHDPKVAGVEIARATRLQLSHLPLLQDVLERYAHRAFLDIELKVPGLEELTLAALKQNPPSGCAVSSFLPDILTALGGRVDVPLGFICDKQAYLPAWRKLPVDYVIPHFKLVTPELADAVHAAGKKLFVWTVNGRERMLRLAAWGADGIISDDTKLLVEVLGRGLQTEN